MATQDLEHPIPQINRTGSLPPENLIPEIASVYRALAELHEKGRHLWTEDENALLLCLDRLVDAVVTLECRTAEDCLALFTIFKPFEDLDPDGGPFDVLKCRVFDFAQKTLPKAGEPQKNRIPPN